MTRSLGSDLPHLPPSCLGNILSDPCNKTNYLPPPIEWIMKKDCSESQYSAALRTVSAIWSWYWVPYILFPTALQIGTNIHAHTTKPPTLYMYYLLLWVSKVYGYCTLECEIPRRIHVLLHLSCLPDIYCEYSIVLTTCTYITLRALCHDTRAIF